MKGMYAQTNCEKLILALNMVLSDNPQLDCHNLTVCDSTIEEVVLDARYGDYVTETEYQECLHGLYPLHNNVTNVIFLSRPTKIGLWVELFSTEKIDPKWIQECTKYSCMTWFGESIRYRITFDGNGNAIIMHKTKIIYN